MPNSAREEILSRIRGALYPQAQPQSAGSDGEHKNPALTVDSQLQIARRGDYTRDELIERFKAELTRVGGRVHMAADARQVCEHIERLAASIEARTAVGWQAPLFRKIGLGESLEKAGVQLICDGGESGPQDFVEVATRAGLGITAVDYALAETGTLVLLAGEGRARSASLLPPVHVAILEPETILFGLDDLFPHLTARNLSSAITFITGPSRTADIELTLVMGVHGPQQLHVILLMT